MVGITAERERALRNAFANVRKDINDLKRSINRNVLSIEQLSSDAQASTSKDEFYRFLKNLDVKLDALEKRTATVQSQDDFETAVGEKQQNLNAEIKKLRADTADVKKISQLQKQLDTLKENSLTRKDLTTEMKSLAKELNKLHSEFDKADAEKQLQPTLDKLNKQLSTVERNIADIQEAQSNTKDDVKQLQKSEGDIQTTRADLLKLQDEFHDLREAAADKDYVDKASSGKQTDYSKEIEKLRNDIADLDADIIDKKYVDDAAKDLNVSLNDLRKDIDVLMDDVRELRSSGSAGEIEDLREEIKELQSGKQEYYGPDAKEFDELRDEIDKIRSIAEIKQDHKQLVDEATGDIRADLEGVQQALDRMDETMASAPDDEQARQYAEEVKDELLSAIAGVQRDVEQVNEIINNLPQDGSSEGVQSSIDSAELKRIREDLEQIKDTYADKTYVDESHEESIKKISGLSEHVEHSTDEVDFSEYVTQSQIKQIQDNLSTESQQDLNSLRSEIDSLHQQIAELRKEKSLPPAEKKRPKKKEPGFFDSVKSTFIDFFTEEEPPKKEEKEKDENAADVLVYAGVIAIILIALALSYFYFAPSFTEEGPNGTVCSQQYDPVCGVDGEVYTNNCFASVANVQVECRGECPCADIVIEGQGTTSEEENSTLIPIEDLIEPEEPEPEPVVEPEETETPVTEPEEPEPVVEPEEPEMSEPEEPEPIVEEVTIEAPPTPDEECIAEYECTETADGDSYFFDCYHDAEVDDCRCFVGGPERCETINVPTEEPIVEEPGFFNSFRNYIIAGVFILIGIIAFLHGSKSEEPPKKKAEKVDLDQFFERKR